jgi:hypothetical protein
MPIDRPAALTAAYRTTKSPCAILGHIPTGELRDLLKLEKGIPKLEVRVCWTYLDPQGGNSHGTNFAKTVVE